MGLRKYRNLVGLGAFLLVSAAAFGANAAVTDPDSSYPGAICQPAYSTTDPLVHGNSFLYNSSPQMYVTCPVVSKNPGSNGGIQFAAVWVNNPSGKTTTCTLYSNPATGSYVTYQTQSTSAAGAEALYFYNLGAPGFWGNYTLQCSLPQYGYLYSYYVYQNP